jgi:phosphoribosyl-ATP pyrophosphohydrolase/phosphoribosyl-AMP cyclohydrolase/histidinol dehydrogenase
VLLAIDLNAEELEAIEQEIWYQALQLTRLAIVRQSISKSLIIQCKDLPEAIKFSNSYAPEHLILQVDKASEVVEQITNAGSIFVGPWSPESFVSSFPHSYSLPSLYFSQETGIDLFLFAVNLSCGDYASGTNHTLPTYGYAKQYSGVSTLSFLKHITSQELTEDGLRALGPVVEILAQAEGLDAHKNAVSVRLRSLEGVEEGIESWRKSHGQ